MIKVQVGDLLNVKNGILVHGCNCLGYMNSGIAKLIRAKWPEVYEDYKAHERMVGLKLGDVVASDVTNKDSTNNSTLLVVSALTQQECGQDKEVLYVDYDAISASFSRIKLLAKHLKLPVHVPLIGCGLANGKWEEVGPRIEAALGSDIDVTLWVQKESDNPYIKD